MQDGNGMGRRHRRAAISVIGLAAAAVVLAACSSGPSPTGTTTGEALGGQQDASQTRSATPSQAALASVSITPNAGKNINPTTPIVVKASNGTLSSVTVVNTVKGTHVTGDFSADKTTWTSNEDLGYGSTYAVNAVGTNKDGRSTNQQSTVSTLDPAKVAYPNMIPAPASVTSIGVGQPVVFQFDQPVANKKAVQAALTVQTSPSQPGSWYWISDRQVDYRAQEFWQAGTTINVTAKVYGLDFGNGVFGAEDRQVAFHVHDAWIAKADGRTEKMNIYDNGHLVKTMPISMGKQSTPTKVGVHVISSRNQKVQMNSCTYGVCPPDPRAYNETEYWAERISNSGEFVHENPATVGVQGSANVSHGCINLSQANAEWFFNHLGIGDVVEVTNSGGPKMPVWDMYGDWGVSWSTWEAGNA
ncbi:MAG TPA: Ig-like domain-containing protein [Pseudonocardiaceae bacterium]|nr:Ig-like domain-containing protein [Pseudonocardiaceae bacterium]